MYIIFIALLKQFRLPANFLMAADMRPINRIFRHELGFKSINIDSKQNKIKERSELVDDHRFSLWRVIWCRFAVVRNILPNRPK